jgi:hypothetical protein
MKATLANLLRSLHSSSSPSMQHTRALNGLAEEGLKQQQWDARDVFWTSLLCPCKLHNNTVNTELEILNLQRRRKVQRGKWHAQCAFA